MGRSLKRHEKQAALDVAKAQAHSRAAQRDRRRRRHLMEASFADAASNHGFKRARWRRLWRQQIQDYLIAAIQHVRILVSRKVKRPSAAMAAKIVEVDLVQVVARMVRSISAAAGAVLASASPRAIFWF